MKKIIRAVSLILAFALLLGLCGCKGEEEVATASENTSTSSVTTSVNSEEQSATTTPETSTPSEQTSSQQTPSQDNSSQVSDVENDPNASAAPTVTICTPVQVGVFAVGGTCPTDTEYIYVSGEKVTETKIIPAKGTSSNYFIGQVKVSDMTSIDVQCKQQGKELSKKVSNYAFYSDAQQNLQTSSDYDATFGANSQAHFYSALLAYSKSNVVNATIEEKAKNNILQTVNNAKGVGAEVIYLVVPTSASVYPETVPSEYTAATGESLYKAFNRIATGCGAKVIYPLDTFNAHKNDGLGYKIYSNTDSHWTTYGAYWGVHDLMSYVSAKYPAAKPRTVSEMQFYTTELYGGDSLFSFKDYNGFENYSDLTIYNGQTVNTKINELTTLYKFKMPTDTLSAITRNKTSIYLTKDNQNAKRETNPVSGLPTAVVVRDSFGRTAYDMINDRFSAVEWMAEGDYASVQNAITNHKPNYVIYIVSERNLLKVMLNNKDIQLNMNS